MSVRKYLGAGVLAALVTQLCLYSLTSTAAAQTAEEEQCFYAVDGKVAWNRSGAVIWNPQNIRNLCQGVKQVQARISCFQAGIAQHGEWMQALEDCKGVGTEVAQQQTPPAPSPPAPTPPAPTPPAPAPAPTPPAPPQTAQTQNNNPGASPYDNQSSPQAGASASEFGPCHTCIYVMERIKKGTNMQVAEICNDLYVRHPGSYGLCNDAVNALALNQESVRYWLFEGCYKYEVYGAKGWIKPCPSHVACAALKQINQQPFCQPLPLENPYLFGN